jgi:hypothetical protein
MSKGVAGGCDVTDGFGRCEEEEEECFVESELGCGCLAAE